MKPLTMMLPLWCLASVCLLTIANGNPTFEGYWYEKPSIAFEYPTVIKMVPKNADIMPTTPIKLENKKIVTKSQLNSGTAATIKATATTMATAATYQQYHPKQLKQQKEKSHEIEKIEKSTVINPTAIKETNLNIKSNKNPQTSTATPAIPATIKTTTEQYQEFAMKTKMDKLNLNQLSTNTFTDPTTASSNSCSLYVQHNETNHYFSKTGSIKTTDPAIDLASQESALEQKLNRNNEHIYRLASTGSHVNNLDNHLPHTQHNEHHGTKRLKLKHDVYHKDHSLKGETLNLKYCCEQSFATLMDKFHELALNRPLERRLTSYKESLKDKEYFE